MIGIQTVRQKKNLRSYAYSIGYCNSLQMKKRKLQFVITFIREQQNTNKYFKENTTTYNLHLSLHLSLSGMMSTFEIN